MSLSATDPLSPFHDPHRVGDLPSWPTTPHSPTDPHPTLVKPQQSPSSRPLGDGPSPGPFGREPQVYGAPEPGLISPRDTVASNGTSFEKPEPYLRVRITSLDRNRRDILIRFDAQVYIFPSYTSTQGFSCHFIDQSTKLYGHHLQKYFEVICRVSKILRTDSVQ